MSAVPASEVEICNLALDRFGERPIANIDNPQTTAEITMARHFAQVRQELLRKYVWNFGKKRASISRSGTPEFDYADKYQLPNDFVRLLSVNGDTEVQQSKDYDIEGRELLIDASGAASIKIRYIKDVTDVSQWDSLFRTCMILSLALATAYQFTKKKALVDQINGLLAAELPDAVSIDGQEKPPVRIQRSKYLAARQMGGYSTGVASQYTVLP